MLEEKEEWKGKIDDDQIEKVEKEYRPIEKERSKFRIILQ